MVTPAPRSPYPFVNCAETKPVGTILSMEGKRPPSEVAQNSEVPQADKQHTPWQKCFNRLINWPFAALLMHYYPLILS